MPKPVTVLIPELLTAFDFISLSNAKSRVTCIHVDTGEKTEMLMKKLSVRGERQTGQ